ncbi:MAG: F-type H+-transporting ATPase subunit gamma [Candidatus Sumerlaeota bacterium]|nr:F-type H+-transporting ATPase subunit gamma [Candidatus Sumerlaeota bacterium]
MAKGIKELRFRIRSIRNTKKITRAMEMVSAAKLRRSQTQMEAARPFARKLETLLGRLALSPTAREHNLFETRDKQTLPTLYVVFTSDRGLCGAFNANIIKAAERAMKGENVLIYTVGRKGRDYFRKRVAEKLVGQMIDLGGKLDGTATDEIGNALLQLWDDKKVAEINIVASHFISTASNRPEVSRYLPLEPEAFGLSPEEAEHPVDYILEPSPDRVFDALLPRYLRSKIFLTLAESFTSEHASRMLAMNNATSNCDELSEKLTLQMNKARQAAITTEIVEIVSGAEALNG